MSNITVTLALLGISLLPGSLLPGSRLSAAPTAVNPTAAKSTAAKPTAPHFALTDLGPLPHAADDIAPGLSAKGAVAAWSARPQGGFQARYWKSTPEPPMGLPSTGPQPVEVTSPDADLFAADVNAQGLLVGVARDPRDLRFTQAFFWRSGDKAPTVLPTLGGAHASACAVSDLDLIVGTADLPGDLHHACLWQQGTARDLGTLPGGDFSAAGALNAHGDIVGISNTVPNGKNQAFLWRKGRMQALGLLPGGSQSAARGVNVIGDAVGYGDVYGGDIHPILWHDGQPKDLGTLGEDPAAAWGVNAAGQVVGTSAISSGKMRAFFWQQGKIYDLNDLIPPGTGWVLETAYRINRRGWILGMGRLRGVSRLFLLRPIPLIKK